jgi:hypothetical protein
VDFVRISLSARRKCAIHGMHANSLPAFDGESPEQETSDIYRRKKSLMNAALNPNNDRPRTARCSNARAAVGKARGAADAPSCGGCMLDRGLALPTSGRVRRRH